MKTTKVTTKVMFTHSYSKEFGFEITKDKPERKVTVYWVFFNDEMENIKIEYTTSDKRYWVFSRSESVDTWLESEFFDTMDQAKEYILQSYLKTIEIK